jgi:hypothetical protein
VNEPLLNQARRFTTKSQKEIRTHKTTSTAPYSVSFCVFCVLFLFVISVVNFPIVSELEPRFEDDRAVRVLLGRVIRHGAGNYSDSLRRDISPRVIEMRAIEEVRDRRAEVER